MLRSRVAPLARTIYAPARTPKRSYATPPPGQDKGFLSNNVVYTALAITAAAGAYYYYAGGTDAPRNRARSAQTEEMMARKARESLQTGRAHAEEIQEKTKGKYNEAKAAGQEAVESTRLGLDNKLREAEQRAREAAADVQANVDQYKKSAGNTLSGARESTENLYKEARSNTNRKVSELASEAERKGDEAKEGWFGWLRTGKRHVADKAAESADEVKKGAERERERR